MQASLRNFSQGPQPPEPTLYTDFPFQPYEEKGC